jgi:hypothetical protein
MVATLSDLADPAGVRCFEATTPWFGVLLYHICTLADGFYKAATGNAFHG